MNKANLEDNRKYYNFSVIEVKRDLVELCNSEAQGLSVESGKLHSLNHYQDQWLLIREICELIRHKDLYIFVFFYICIHVQCMW